MAFMGELTQGMKVRSRDGEDLGKIILVENDTFLVEKGFFFPKDYSIPTSLVSEVRDGEVWLSADRDVLRAGSGTIEEERTTARTEETGAQRGMEGEGEQRMQLSEEELEARKRVHEAGAVNVKKDVVTEHRRIDVPVTKEEVRVERTPASGAAPEGEAFRDETLRVPVREEEVEITKKPRVREEVRVSKSARQEERRAEGEVRREEARVERTGEGPRRGEPDDDESR